MQSLQRINDLAKAIDLEPNYVNAHLQKAACEIALGLIAEARKTLEVAHKLDTVVTDDQLYAANCYFEIGELVKVEQICKLILTDEPDHPGAKQLLHSVKRGQ